MVVNEYDVFFIFFSHFTDAVFEPKLILASIISSRNDLKPNFVIQQMAISPGIKLGKENFEGGKFASGDA